MQTKHAIKYSINIRIQVQVHHAPGYLTNLTKVIKGLLPLLLLTLTATWA